MTHQEYYEKYWTVDGKPVPPLTDYQKWQITQMAKISKDMALGMMHGMRLRAMIGPRPRFKPLYLSKLPDFLQPPLNNSSNGETINYDETV